MSYLEQGKENTLGLGIARWQHRGHWVPKDQDKTGRKHRLVIF